MRAQEVVAMLGLLAGVVVVAVVLAVALASLGGGRRCQLCSGRRTVYYPHSGETKVCDWCQGTGRR